MSEMWQFGMVEAIATLFFLGLCAIAHRITRRIEEDRAEAAVWRLFLPEPSTSPNKSQMKDLS